MQVVRSPQNPAELLNCKQNVTNVSYKKSEGSDTES